MIKVLPEFHVKKTIFSCIKMEDSDVIKQKLLPKSQYACTLHYLVKKTRVTSALQHIVKDSIKHGEETGEQNYIQPVYGVRAVPELRGSRSYSI